VAEYKAEECPWKYQITSIEKVVDGDTFDAVFDLGFDVRFKSRVRLLGIDTPESRTRNKNEKVYGLLSKKNLKKWINWAIESDRDDVTVELRCPEQDSRGKFGRILGNFLVERYEGEEELVTDVMIEEGHAVKYYGQNKADIARGHITNRNKLMNEGVLRAKEVQEAAG